MSPGAAIKKTGESIAPWVNIAFMILLAVSGWLLIEKMNQFGRTEERLEETRTELTEQIQVLREFMAETKGNRFTDDDGAEVWKAIAELQTVLAATPKEYPPAWFKSEFDSLKAAVEEVQKSVNLNSQNIIRVQADVEILKVNCTPSTGG